MSNIETLADNDSIDIQIVSDKNPFGAARLLLKITDFLKNEGYTNVIAKSEHLGEPLPTIRMFDYEKSLGHLPYLDVRVNITDKL